MVDFGISETLLAIGAASAAAGAGTAAYSAVEQNVAAKREKAASAREATVRSQQVRDQASIEKLKVMRRAAQIRGRLQLAGAESGLGDFSSLDALERQNQIDTGLNLDILEKNTQNTQGLIGSQLGSELARISGSYRNELLAGFQGALGGAEQGLVIGQGIDNITRPRG